MHVVTHLLIGWTVAEHTTKSPRDRALIAWASVAPDLDGLGLIVDVAAPLFDWTVQWYDRFRHVLLHGLPGAVVITALMTWFARKRLAAGCLLFSRLPPAPAWGPARLAGRCRNGALVGALPLAAV
jgi:hypothetical protein